MKKPLTLLAVALLCVSCAPVANTTPAPAASTSKPTASAPVSLSANSGPQAPGGTVPATIGIAWDQASKDEAMDVAENAMTDFARPTVEDKQWANDLARWLTPQATADYSAVDPANIPVERHARCAKRDRLDAIRLVMCLRAWLRGELDCVRVVRMPTAQA